jgi:NADH-quinone oxidoreductase subunit C
MCGHDETPPTISTIFSSAAWLEREVHEFFGIQFIGNIDLRPLLLPEDTEINPLKKTFGIVAAYRKRDEIYA